MNEELKEIIAKLFKLKIEDVPDVLSNETIKEWDSLNHLRLILSIERKYNTKFPSNEIPHLNSVLTISKRLQELINSKGESQIKE
jgi:acyl carrier protein